MILDLCLLTLRLLSLALLPSLALAQDWPASDRFAAAEPPALDASERERLAAGEVIVRKLAPTDGSGIGVLTMGYVAADAEQVWAVMADCEEQEDFLPRVLHSEVRDRVGDSHICELEVDLPFPLDDPRTSTRHHVRRLPDGGYQRRWELLPDDPYYRRNRGSWTVHPLGSGTLIVSRVDLLPRTPIPAWLLQAAQTRQAPATFEAIRERVRIVTPPSLSVPRSGDRDAPKTPGSPPGSPP